MDPITSIGKLPGDKIFNEVDSMVIISQKQLYFASTIKFYFCGLSSKLCKSYIHISDRVEKDRTFNIIIK